MYFMKPITTFEYDGRYKCNRQVLILRHFDLLTTLAIVL